MLDNTNITSLICARSGSKGLPGKNIKNLCGKPLIVYSIDIAKSSKYINTIVVSTDSSEIADIALINGASIPYLRPKEIAKDDTPEWLVWQDVLKYLDSQNQLPHVLVILPPTAPLRSLEDVDGAILKYLNNDCDGIICTTDAHRNPYFNMIMLDENGFCKLPLNNKTQIFRRQDTPKIFDLTTVCYVMSPKFILEKSHLFDGDLMMQHVPIERSVDIDTQLDFDIAEFLINRREYGV
jgi:CMP-N-acetylneuraminic acid synthetase